MKMLISGGNGFLGSYLVERALVNGIEVTVVDDLSTSKDIQVPKEANFIKKKIEKFSTKEKFDFIVHMAARPSPEDYIKKPLRTIMSNSIGTYKLLELARKSNAVFMYTSSSEVYGDASIIPTPEEYYGYVNPNGIRSCYDESKRFSEALIMSYKRAYDLDVRIQRPFNVYGPRIRADGFYGRVIPRFIMQALENRPLTVHGDGMQTRSFLYISDWLEATWKLITIKEPKYRIINIGSDREIAIVELAKLIKSLTNSNSKIISIEKREDDPQRRAADIKKANEMLGFKPNIKLEDGLAETIGWFRSKMGQLE
ncbi:MAG: NAD-dependent epimerase/dehydratase family protein [Candidatus Micrarchaeia archaeon]